MQKGIIRRLAESLSNTKRVLIRIPLSRREKALELARWQMCHDDYFAAEGVDVDGPVPMRLVGKDPDALRTEINTFEKSL